MDNLIINWKNPKVEASTQWLSDGWCKVTHNLGHTNYGVMLTLKAIGVIWIESTYNTYFIVRTTTTSGAASSIDFSFVIVGDNSTL